MLYDANNWRKSTRSGNNGGECVEVASTAASQVLVRDTKQQDKGPMLAFSASAWREFLKAQYSQRP
ncbi:hypothetical protein GCM10009765_12700 [Fodinicola feengrottensis]|uniref:DUF397 domain-containing protein n=1 Tax=Fodinicola feengrottensis TaxID=435914 RepID=A0ABN2G370_9ACTN